jgi:hypothetical protein
VKIERCRLEALGIADSMRYQRLSARRLESRYVRPHGKGVGRDSLSRPMPKPGLAARA